MVVISAHPPSGKAYDTELIRIPAKRRHAGRYHLDIIFIVESFIFLCELKGKTSESADDIIKLRNLTEDYTFAELITFISKRVNTTGIAWESIKSAVLVVGAAVDDAILPGDFTTIVAGDQDTFRVAVGCEVPNAYEVERALAKVF